MEHREVDGRQATSRGASADDPAQFLRELRQLRHGAGLGHAELAARAHYPCDYIMAAEAGPALPDLPMLAAYVSGCGGVTQEWEERWRSLTGSPALLELPTRSAGRSVAATAGARVGSTTPAMEGPDPAVIRSALDRVAAGIASTGSATAKPATAASAASAASAERGTPGHAPVAAAPGPLAPEIPQVPPPSATATPGIVFPPSAAGPAARGAAPGPTTERLGAILPGPSRTTIMALAAIAVCVLVVVLAIFA